MGITWEDLKAEEDANYFVERITKGEKITQDEWEWAIDNVDIEKENIRNIIVSNEEYSLHVRHGLRYWPEEDVTEFFNK